VPGSFDVAYPDHPHEEPREAQGYARPHELDVSRSEGSGGFWARLRHCGGTGALARLDLEDEQGAVLQVEMPRDRFDALQLVLGERLYVRPRRVRVFLDA
jgi:sulfate transport system ATP-binding protein